MDAATTATLACQRLRNGQKREDCGCDPCGARRAIFGANIPVQLQESRRAGVESGVLDSLDQIAKIQRAINAATAGYGLLFGAGGRGWG